jgi:hypothetical protein
MLMAAVPWFCAKRAMALRLDPPALPLPPMLWAKIAWDSSNTVEIAPRLSTSTLLALLASPPNPPTETLTLIVRSARPLNPPRLAVPANPPAPPPPPTLSAKIPWPFFGGGGAAALAASGLAATCDPVEIFPVLVTDTGRRRRRCPRAADREVNR